MTEGVTSRNRWKPTWESAVKSVSFRSLKRLLTFLVALLSAATLFVVIPLQVVEVKHPTGAVRGLLWPLVVVVILRCATSSFVLQKLLPQPEHSLPIPDNARDIEWASIQRFTDNFDEEELATLIAICCDPAGHVIRISESIEIADLKYITSVTRTVLSPRDGFPTRLLIPIMRARKGTLVDNLSITVNGDPGRTLSYLESQGAMLSTLEVLYDTVFPGGDSKIRQRLLDAALDDDRVGGQTRSLLVDDLGKQQVATGTGHHRDALVNLAYDSCDSYLLVVVADCYDKRAIKIGASYTVPSRAQTSQTSPVFNMTRVALGLAVRTHSLQLPNATDAPSYHLRITLPDSLYVYDSTLTYNESAPIEEQLNAGTPALSPEYRPRRPVLKHSPTTGLDYIHVYARDLDRTTSSRHIAEQSGPTQARVSLLLQFRERPPGLLGIVLLLSIYLTALTWGVGHFHDVVFPPPPTQYSPSTVTSTWPAILFGIPALISGWLVSRFTPAAAKYVSLPTLLMTAWTVLNAAVAVTVAALKLSVPSFRNHAFLGLNILQPTWSLVMFSCMVSSILGVVMLGNRMLRFVTRVGRT